MLHPTLLLIVLITTATVGGRHPTEGIISLVRRRLPDHSDNFLFSLNSSSRNSTTENDHRDVYTVSTQANGSIHVEGNSQSALAVGLHRYLSQIVHADIYWFVGSHLHTLPSSLPKLHVPLKGESIVTWRYHLNPGNELFYHGPLRFDSAFDKTNLYSYMHHTVTFSYTTAFWTWEDWELELDWAALRGVNLILAWVGYEKVLLDSLREIGMTDEEILPFFSGPAFQAWNRFGNIQGSWGGHGVSIAWIEAQFELQKKIVSRIVELGMTPVLPAFPGFVPPAIKRVRPHATVVNGSQWSGFQKKFTEVSFLNPLDETFAQLQKSVISRQTRAFGNVTHVYALDQFNEINPASGELGYLRNLSLHTWQSLKAVNPAAVWMMQGWLFYDKKDFWDPNRISAYLSGVERNDDMLILDLYSESKPQWQRTESYFGKPWIWCQLHDFGGNMGMYGQIMNITSDPIEALNKSDSLVGFGLTMEGQEGNEIVYDLLLDQAWSAKPIDTRAYFQSWVRSRYSGNFSVPNELYTAWDLLRKTVYNNTNLTTYSLTKSIFEISPDIAGLVGRVGHYPTPTSINYDPMVLNEVWSLFMNATRKEPSLWHSPAYEYDMVDITRQLMGNAFVNVYSDLISSWKSETENRTTNVTSQSERLLNLLSAIDKVLSCNENFSLTTWISSARDWGNTTETKDFFEYNARNQITLWGPTGEISDYASKAWAGLISSYYKPRWSIFVDYLGEKNQTSYNETELKAKLHGFEMSWQEQKINEQDDRGQTAISLAAEHGQERAVAFLVTKADTNHVEINALDHRRSTPLCYAAYNGNPFTIELLIARNDVDLYCGTYDNRFPLSLAVESGNCTTIKLLLNRMRQQNPKVTGEVDHQFSAELNRSDLWGRTPLFIATEQGREDMVGLLVSLPEVDVNARTIRYGQGTALASAAKNGRENIVQLLLSRPDIDIGARDIHGRTPIQLATLEGHKSIALMLQRFHLDPDSEV
ncbi:Alpha-N-acetylglucosaminidase, tim-barrel domain [Aspergillus oryzae]|uniref:Alpha-N-acetylglucosaminidase, tim-barrel domain n=1 Tax=Aspergillus oryzae TaxID=5062 RepID=A0A1S9DEE1_ASPOZ|nr:Alpha-N-acetylglucosaminidase, tim-barrel domain [Aspergillus oryzae]